MLGIAVVLIVLIIVFITVSASAKKKMTPAETGRLTEDVYAVKDRFVNMYLVKDGNEYHSD